MTELTVICERCLKYAHTEAVQTPASGAGDHLFLVTCHGQTRLINTFRVPSRSGGARALWEHLTDHVTSENAHELIDGCNTEIARLQRLVAAAKKLTK